jgi:glycine dehydrogenase subunit 2
MPEPGGRAIASPLLGGGAEPTLAALSAPGRRAWSLPALDVPRVALDLPESASAPPCLPELSERDLVAHFTRLSQRNFGVDMGAYPLGSCTMKYNPKVCDWAADLRAFRDLHPATPAALSQGALAVLAETERLFCEITGMGRASFQPPAGAAAELAGLLIIRAYHAERGTSPTRIIIPDSAHGTNPASVSLAGYEVVPVPSTARGLVDVRALARLMDDRVAGLMLTNPNTLGLFEEDSCSIAELVHGVDGLVYYDGANLNAILGVARPGDMGFDIVHANLHKTFATPHGGGGPGAGPIAVVGRLARYLPGPLAGIASDGALTWEYPQASIGRVHGAHGNFLVVLRALAYMRALGGAGLRRVAEMSVLNARYLSLLLSGDYEIPYPGPCMHEFVASASSLSRESGLRAADVAKALPDAGFHAPTMYFPLIVDEALMIEPTETESLETLRALAKAFQEVARAARAGEPGVHEHPAGTPVRRLDDASAARRPVLTWFMEE